MIQYDVIGFFIITLLTFYHMSKCVIYVCFSAHSSNKTNFRAAIKSRFSSYLHGISRHDHDGTAHDRKNRTCALFLCSSKKSRRKNNCLIVEWEESISSGFGFFHLSERVGLKSSFWESRPLWCHKDRWYLSQCNDNTPSQVCDLPTETILQLPCQHMVQQNTSFVGVQDKL